MSKSQSYIGAPNGVVVCVNEVSHEFGIKGFFYHSYSTEPVHFTNVDVLIFSMDELFNKLKFPYPANSERRFRDINNNDSLSVEKEKVMDDDKLLQKHGDIGTFIVRVQHRQNSSWQGRITWTEENKTIQFRSIWEMIKLIESAVNSVSEPEEFEGSAGQTWFEG